jgi:hypothetical protein
LKTPPVYEGETRGPGFAVSDTEILTGWLILISLFMPLILCLTVVASVGIGVMAAYMAVFGILHAFGQRSQPRPAEARPRLVLVPTQTHASGD